MTLFAILAAFAADVSVASFGAVADGSEKCTRAFAAAIAACEKAGGGRVVVPQGLYFTGPIHLKSDVELHLEDGAIVEFSDDPADCLPAVRSSWEGLECLNYSPLVYAYCATNVALTGRGTIRSTHVRTARRPTRCNASVTAHPMVKDCFHKQNKGRIRKHGKYEQKGLPEGSGVDGRSRNCGRVRHGRGG